MLTDSLLSLRTFDHTGCMFSCLQINAATVGGPVCTRRRTVTDRNHQVAAAAAVDNQVRWRQIMETDRLIQVESR